MLLESGYTCAFCGEWIDTSVDASAGRTQTYVEDCQVCCRPNVLHIEVSRTDGDWQVDIDASPESE